MLITDEIVAACIKAAGQVVAATKREGDGTTRIYAQMDGEYVAVAAKAMLAELKRP